MAEQSAMRYALRRIDRAFRKYAAIHGWQPADYKVFVKWSEVIDIHIGVILQAKSLPGKTKQEQWENVLDFLNRELKDDKPLRRAIGLVTETFEEAAVGVGVPSSYEPIEDLIGPPATV